MGRNKGTFGIKRPVDRIAIQGVPQSHGKLSRSNVSFSFAHYAGIGCTFLHGKLLTAEDLKTQYTSANPNPANRVFGL